MAFLRSPLARVKVYFFSKYLQLFKFFQKYLQLFNFFQKYLQFFNFFQKYLQFFKFEKRSTRVGMPTSTPRVKVYMSAEMRRNA